jgi:hypothetical protein
MLTAAMSAQVSAAHAARMYGRSEKTVRRWIAAGKLPAEKVDGAYLVDLADVARLVGDVSAPTSAQVSAPGTDSVSAQGADADVRPGDGDVRPPERPAALAQAEAMASLIQTTIAAVLGPLVGQLEATRQTTECQAEQLRVLERENGQLQAELAAERAKSSLDASTAPRSESPTLEPLSARWRQPWPPWPLLALGAAVAVIIMLVVLPMLVMLPVPTVPRW